MKVREHLEKRGERDVVFLSITIDSDVDDSEQLELYRERYAHHFENWYHLTGDFDEIESLRYALGVYDLDPEIDSERPSTPASSRSVTIARTGGRRCRRSWT